MAAMLTPEQVQAALENAEIKSGGAPDAVAILAAAKEQVGGQEIANPSALAQAMVETGMIKSSSTT